MILEQSDIFDRRINQKGSLHLGIEPWETARLQPASYEIALAPQFRIFDPTLSVIDAMNPGDYTWLVNIDDDEQPWYDVGYYLLRPGEFILGSSVETFVFPNDLAGELTGRSSLGRIGLQVHATAGYFDPGFTGTATLEICNISPCAIRLQPGLIIAQMKFFKLSRESQWPYGSAHTRSHYQGQSGPTASRLGHVVPQQLRLQPASGPEIDWDAYDERPGSDS